MVLVPYSLVQDFSAPHIPKARHIYLMASGENQEKALERHKELGKLR